MGSYRLSGPDELMRRFAKIEKDILGILGFIQLLNSSNSVTGSSGSTTSTTPVSSTPTHTAVAVTTGASETVSVAMSATMANSTGALAGWYLFVDGSSYAGPYGNDNNTGGSLGVACSASLIISGLTAGASHTFEMKFLTSSGAVTASWSLPTILAEPL